MTTVEELRSDLKCIDKWGKRLPRTWSDVPLRASRTGDGIHVQISSQPLPGGMERVIDDWENHGALGIHSQLGIRDALSPWQDELRGMGAPAMPGTGPVDYLTATAQWAIDHMPTVQWDMMAADVHGVWERVQHLVCPTKEVITLCPDVMCNGILRANTGKHGIVDTATCDGCGKEFHTDPDQYAHDVRAVGQGLTVNPLAVVTVAQIERLWAGEINADIVKKWVKRGKLTPRDTTPATYPLAKVNVLAHDLIERRRRRAEKVCKASA